MTRFSRYFPVVLALIPAASWAQRPVVELECEPSRACAIEMAREAARKNFRLREDLHTYASAWLAIGYAQLAAGDTTGVASTIAEMQSAFGPDDETGYRAHLAELQARAGQSSEALATVRSTRDSETRDTAYARIASALAEAGQWSDALEIAKMTQSAETSARAESDVLFVLVKTGRRDWVREAVAVLAPQDEALWLSQVELVAGDLGAARAEALRIADVEGRLTMIEEIGSKASEQGMWEELAITARLIPADAPKVDSSFMSDIHHGIAIEWLTLAGAFDEALALLPRLSADQRVEKRAELAREQALAGDYRRSQAMLDSIDPDYRSQVRAAIETGKVLAGDEKLEVAMKAIPELHLRLEALELLGQQLPDSRLAEARAALREAVDVAPEADVEAPAIVLGQLAEWQAERGFIDDALATALTIKDTEESLGAYGDIGVAQAAKGLLDDARKTFVIAEAQARKYGFTSEDRAWLTNSIAKAGLLPETFAQVRALARRDPDEYFFDQLLDSAIQAHVQAGEVGRAFEIATLLSEHDSGNPHYFLVLAEALQPPTG